MSIMQKRHKEKKARTLFEQTEDNECLELVAAESDRIYHISTTFTPHNSCVGKGIMFLWQATRRFIQIRKHIHVKHEASIYIKKSRITEQ